MLPFIRLPFLTPSNAMPARPTRTLLRFLAVAVALAAGIATAVLFDWRTPLPEGTEATYVGRESCRECHEQEVERWHGSDHHLAMKRATPEFVRGDFEDREFVRVPFLEFPALLDAETMHLLAARTEPAEWAVAMKTAETDLQKQLFLAMTDEFAEAVRLAMANRSQVRPCDAVAARYRLGRAATDLAVERGIALPEANRSRFWRDGDKYFVQTEGPDGRQQVFPVKYTFGIEPLQQYLVALPRGRLQCLPVAWDTEEKTWFHLYPDESIPHDDMLHWTRPLQTWNYMCAECHSTNLQKNYDVRTDTYHTSFSEIDVSCESCHGPGSVHVQLSEARSLFWDRLRGFGLPNLKSEDSHVEIETCAPCHSRRRVIYPGFKPGDKYLDYYVPEMLDTDLYYADGQILDEDFEYSSFIQSVMYRKGVRCSDCHEPCTTKVKFDDNRLCGQCHLPAQYDTPRHHFHPDSSQPGTRCVECHMADTTYMVVDARRDHGMNTPRPHLTVDLGIPNACTRCHDDGSKGETPEWAVKHVEAWYGKPKGPPHFAHAIAAGRDGRPEGRRMLQEVARRDSESAIVRASALLLLGRYPSAQP
ncbi:MAG: multiheme c-type cytochrome, partial [Patescibacteria group bacterium]|nr:multiheme c-type cytochrome [Patescibacteria group bacterium]